MTIHTISDSERDPSQSPDGAQSPTDAVVDRLAELLPVEALEDALNGLEPEEITGPGGLLTQLAGRVIETALGAELTEQLGHPPGGVAQGPNVRNGAGRKTVSTDLGLVEIKTPRDREGSFEPKLVAKRQTRLAGLDDKILGLYAGGMTVRDISAHLSELYGVQVGRDTISRVTDAVLEGRAGVADQAAGCGLSDRLLRRAVREGPRGPLRARPRLLPRARRDLRRRSRGPRALVAGDRRREVLAGRPQRPAPPRRRGRPHQLRRRPEGLPGGDRGHVPTGLGADLHRAPDPQLAALRQLPRPQEGRLRAAADLHRPQRGGRPLRARALRFGVGRALPGDRRRLARVVGARDPVHGAARRAAPRGLHHQHNRGPAPPDPQGDQDPRTLPRRTGRHQAHLPRADARRRQVAEEPDLDSTARRAQDPLRRPIPRLTTTCRLGLTHSSSDSLSNDTRDCLGVLGIALGRSQRPPFW